MSVLTLVQATEWPLTRRALVALTAAIGRGPVFLGADSLTLIAIALVAPLLGALGALIRKEGR